MRLVQKADEYKAEIKYLKKIQKTQGKALVDRVEAKADGNDKKELAILRKENKFMKAKVLEQQ